jgi:hypothetical protein
MTSTLNGRPSCLTIVKCFADSRFTFKCADGRTNRHNTWAMMTLKRRRGGIVIVDETQVPTPLVLRGPEDARNGRQRSESLHSLAASW